MRQRERSRNEEGAPVDEDGREDEPAKEDVGSREIRGGQLDLMGHSRCAVVGVGEPRGRERVSRESSTSSSLSWAARKKGPRLDFLQHVDGAYR